MPYKNIVFVKLEKRLFNDPRFYMLSEKAQLNYVKFMLFAAETYNRIPTNLSAIRKGFKTNQSNLAIENTIFEIRKVFPKFKKNGEFYYFEDFDSKTNYIRDFPSIAEGTPKEVIDIDIDKEKDIDIEKLATYWNSALTTPKLIEREFIEELFSKFGFKKTKNIIRQFAEGNFRSVKTMRLALNPDGSIKPKTEKKEEGITIDKVG